MLGVQDEDVRCGRSRPTTVREEEGRGEGERKGGKGVRIGGETKRGGEREQECERPPRCQSDRGWSDRHEERDGRKSGSGGREEGKSKFYKSLDFCLQDKSQDKEREEAAWYFQKV